MSGTVDQICGAAPNVFPPGAVTTILGDVMYHLLYYQYITSDHLPARVWQVTKGSGMGLLHSGSIKGAAFYVAVERDWAADVAIQKNLRSFGTLVSKMTVFLSPGYGSVA